MIRFMIVVPVYALVFFFSAMSQAGSKTIYTAGHPALKQWLMPDTPNYPTDNKPSKERIQLGKKLFFDRRLSGDGTMSCATCHNPALGWTDGLPTARGLKGKVLRRATPTLLNSGYNILQMWDGRKKTLEEQAIAPMKSALEMNVNSNKLLRWLQSDAEYKKLFNKAYPNEKIGTATLSKAIAAFERTLVSNNSAFDRWVKGDKKAMSKQQINGFKLFTGKAKCVVCHAAPNFTDNGFHNIGLASWGKQNPDLGRFKQRPLAIMKGAFKTPTLRDIALTAPYFHDGSAKTLKQVVDFYVSGGVIKTNLSPNLSKIELSKSERESLVAFLKALTSKIQTTTLPILPVN